MDKLKMEGAPELLLSTLNLASSALEYAGVHAHDLEQKNKQLEMENAELKGRIAKLQNRISYR